MVLKPKQLMITIKFLNLIVMQISMSLSCFGNQGAIKQEELIIKK